MVIQIFLRDIMENPYIKTIYVTQLHNIVVDGWFRFIAHFCWLTYRREWIILDYCFNEILILCGRRTPEFLSFKVEISGFKPGKPNPRSSFGYSY